MAVLINDHQYESCPNKLPLFVEKVVFEALAAVGRVLGYKALYPKYSRLEP